MLWPIEKNGRFTYFKSASFACQRVSNLCLGLAEKRPVLNTSTEAWGA